MPEIRQNIATKEWVIIASERSKRPEQFITNTRPVTGDLPAHDTSCPFCPGNEEGPEFEVLRVPTTGPWQLRVLRNRYPAVGLEGDPQRHFHGVERSINAVGFHEVVVESPLHNTTPALQSDGELAWTLFTLQKRARDIARDSRIEHILVFKNHGPSAGASIAHPHSQIIGLPIVPHNTRNRMEEARRYFDDTGHCVYCHMLAEELKEGTRVVAENAHHVALVPYAASTPFHVWLMPKRHRHSFLGVPLEEIEALAALLRLIAHKLYVGLRDPDYNFMLRSAPMHEPGRDYTHWYISIVPRLSTTAGFELGSGMRINVAVPEESAAFLRGAAV